MTLYRILSSGSHGNAIIYNDELLVDFGVSYATVEPHLNKIKYLLITHEHGDHMNTNAILRMSVEYPNIEVIGSSTTMGILKKNGLRKTNVVKPRQKYRFGDYEIEPENMVHEVPTLGYKIIIKDWIAYYADGKKYVSQDFKIFHATDTGSLSHVEAVGFNLYALEANYKEELLQAGIEKKKAAGKFVREYRSRRDHMEVSETYRWLSKNDTNKAIVILLHSSTEYGGGVADDQLEVFKKEWIDNY